MARSRQRKYGGGKAKSERQRRFLYAVYPRAAKKWARGLSTRKSDWVPRRAPRPYRRRRR